MPGDARGRLSRWIQRRSAISAVLMAVAVLPVLPTGATTRAVELAEPTAASSFGGSQQEPQFSVSPIPNSAGPGDTVEVSISSLDPLVVITGCAAGFAGAAAQECVRSGDVWSVTLQVPTDAAPGAMGIDATIAYSDNRDPDGGQPGETTVTVPFTVVLPTGSSSVTTGSAPTTVVPPTTVVGPTTVVPPSVPETTSSSGGTSNLWILLVILVLVLLVLIAALVGRSSRRRPRPRERVQARLREGPPPVPRIEQISERPAWAIRIEPHRDRATERVEEMQR
jgi:hypothetical protein